MLGGAASVTEPPHSSPIHGAPLIAIAEACDL